MEHSRRHRVANKRVSLAISLFTRDAQFVKELLRVRDNEISLRDFAMSEISALIERVCVT